jgi:hypothetical protein
MRKLPGFCFDAACVKYLGRVVQQREAELHARIASSRNARIHRPFEQS